MNELHCGISSYVYQPTDQILSGSLVGSLIYWQSLYTVNHLLDFTSRTSQSGSFHLT